MATKVQQTEDINKIISIILDLIVENIELVIMFSNKKNRQNTVLFMLRCSVARPKVKVQQTEDINKIISIILDFLFLAVLFLVFFLFLAEEILPLKRLCL